MLFRPVEYVEHSLNLRQLYDTVSISRATWALSDNCEDNGVCWAQLFSRVTFTRARAEATDLSESQRKLTRALRVHLLVKLKVEEGNLAGHSHVALTP